MALIFDAHRSSNLRSILQRCRILGVVAGLATLGMPARAQVNACDLNGDGAVNIADVQLAVNMTVGSAPCAANIMGAGVCNIVVVQRIVNSALGQACVTGSGHSASLTWVASTSTGVSGYNVYRGTASGGPYTLLNATPVSAVNYADNAAQAGQTYFYVIRTVGAGSTLSTASNEVQAVVPAP